MRKNIHREITPLTPEDCLKVFSRTKGTFDYPLHYHGEYELNFIRNAKGALRIVGEHSNPIGEYELVLVAPNLFHGWGQGKCVCDSIYEVTIQFQGDLFHESFLSRNVMKGIHSMLELSKNGVAFSEGLIKRVEPSIVELTKLEGFNSFILFFELLNELSNPLNSQQVTSYPERKSGENKKVEEVYDLVSQHFNEKIKLEDISERMNMTTVSFSRFVKQQLGKPFVTFLNEYRVAHASRMIIESADNISDIALACGFNNQANFNRIFKRIKGCSPKEFRKNDAGLRRII